jgi:hypothetical protein
MATRKVSRRLNSGHKRPSRKTTPRGQGKRKVPFNRFFRHYITGVVYDAWDYGHDAWPFGG